MTQSQNATKPTTLLRPSAGQIQTLCEMTALIAKADDGNAAAGPVPAAALLPVAPVLPPATPGTSGAKGGGRQARVAAPLPKLSPASRGSRSRLLGHPLGSSSPPAQLRFHTEINRCDRRVSPPLPSPLIGGGFAYPPDFWL